MKRIGLIARYDNSGLGTLSWEFARHLNPEKILLVSNGVYQTFPERYSNFTTKKVDGRMTPDDMQWILHGVDVLLSIETFYDWQIIKEARRMKVKTALYTMYEMTPDPIPLHADLYICPSKLDMQYFEPWDHVFLPPPVAEDRLLWKKRTRAHSFVHTASHGGLHGRKGTQLFLDAIPLVKSEVSFTIYSWRPIDIDNTDRRLSVKVVNFENYWQSWREGDVLVYPQDYNGICLPVIEALSSGLGVLSTDIFPFNEYLPKKLLFQPESIYRTRAAPGLFETDAAKISPERIAEKIDEIANTNIEQESFYGKEWARENSWQKLLPQYQEVIESL